MNHATRTIVAWIGVMIGIAGFEHGLFETLQGNTPTTGLIIQAIGDEHQMWFYGTEEAFSIIPNFLATGILAMLTGVAIMIWSVGFVHKKNGPSIFLLLFVFLFLFGGGIGQIGFFIPTWAASTRINKPLTWWRKVLSESIRRVLAKLWPVLLGAFLMIFLIALAIAIFGYIPGMSEPEIILYIDWSLLLAALVLMLFSFVAGFADDIQSHPV